MAKDYSSLSDEELDAIIAGETQQAEKLEATPAKPAIPEHQYTGPVEYGGTGEKQLPKSVDNTLGFSPTELALAGAGKQFYDVGQGLKEKLSLLGKPKGKAGDDLVAKLQRDRAMKAQIDQMLMSNPEAVLGEIGGQVAVGAALPSRLGAQVGTQMLMDIAKPGGKNVASFGGEMAGAGLGALEGGATMYGVGKGVQGLGKLAGAARDDLTETGVEAMKTDAAARRLGLPTPSIGQLAPASGLGQVERNMPGYGETVLEQGRALAKQTGAEKVLGVFDRGAAYKEELTQAARNRLDLGTQKYREVDDFVNANNLTGFQPKYTANIITGTGRQGYERAAELLEKYGWDITPVAGVKPAALNHVTIPMSVYHEQRVATNRALNKVNRMLDGPMPTTEDRLAKKYLTDLKTALDSDAERWASTNKGNEDAMGLYRDATAYYRDVVAPTVLENPLANKLLSRSRGFSTGEEALRAATSTAGNPRVDLLRPTMSQRGEDMTQILRNLPEVAEAAMTGKVPSGRQWSPLQMAGAVTGHPVAAAETVLSRAPVLRELSKSQLAKRLYFAKNALEGANTGRATYGAGQYPQQAAEDTLRHLLGQE